MNSLNFILNNTNAYIVLIYPTNFLASVTYVQENEEQVTDFKVLM